ncbi:hypothetical protein FRAAL4635 [Frankia alni ACN14a]|uniref:Uncharacterized protein n=1 Tax=Frankia alni (strain DSM 45986 / CECT 9034 / ACN14a) TaxID=326424 RepID=Q0RGV9_FRAAA|nr:hypothetical protein FRAAL4635 [Frankia alni ACN14a]
MQAARPERGAPGVTTAPGRDGAALPTPGAQLDRTGWAVTGTSTGPLWGSRVPPARHEPVPALSTRPGPNEQAGPAGSEGREAAGAPIGATGARRWRRYPGSSIDWE